MSLIKKHELTKKQLTSVRQNQKFSHGPATAEGRERIRAAHLRHGFYAPAEEVALRAIGEDPAQFEDLLEGLWETYDPTNAAQEGLVIRLARAMWLMNRADRIQEGYAVRQATEVSSGREDRVHAQMMRLKMTEERLKRLAESVADEHYVTTREDIEKMKNLHQEGNLKEMGEMALALFYQLQPPGTGEDGVDPHETARDVVRSIKEIFGIGITPDFAPPEKIVQDSQSSEEGPQDAAIGEDGGEDDEDERYPYITAAEWEARERPRQLLENILTRKMQACEAHRKALLKESVKGPSPYERAAEMTPTHPQALLMRRLQDSYFREVRRSTNLLLKLKHHELKMAHLKEAALGDDSVRINKKKISSEYVDDKEGT